MLASRRRALRAPLAVASRERRVWIVTSPFQNAPIYPRAENSVSLQVSPSARALISSVSSPRHHLHIANRIIHYYLLPSTRSQNLRRVLSIRNYMQSFLDSDFATTLFTLYMPHMPLHFLIFLLYISHSISESRCLSLYPWSESQFNNLILHLGHVVATTIFT